MKRIKDDWLDKAMDESARRVEEIHWVGYEPQSEKKKLGPWGTGGGKRRVTMDEMLDMEERRMNDMMVDDDVVGYYDNDNDYDMEGGGMNAHDGAMDSEAFYSCWDRSS